MNEKSELSYFQYKTLSDLLKVILHSSQSPLGAIPLIHYTNFNNRHILFIQTIGMGGNTVRYVIEKEKPKPKFIELKRLTGEFSFVEKIGSDAMSLYIPLLELEKSTLVFP
ncbi:MAG: hypothetical protein HZA82_04715 [Thaumarchaeota archaeon]|nr:hypothetical protein [Nitrososphaerota archaeon]